MDMDFAVSRPLVQRLRLISGFCPSTRTFAPRFLQTPPRDGSPCAFASPSPPSGWAEDFHLRAAEHAQHTTSPRIAEAFGVREDTVRLWRSDFIGGGVAALKATVAPGPPPVKSEAALGVVTPLLEAPVADRRNWTIARLRAEIAGQAGITISRSQLSKVLRKKTSAGGGPATR